MCARISTPTAWKAETHTNTPAHTSTIHPAAPQCHIKTEPNAKQMLSRWCFIFAPLATHIHARFMIHIHIHTDVRSNGRISGLSSSRCDISNFPKQVRASEVIFRCCCCCSVGCRWRWRLNMLLLLAAILRASPCVEYSVHDVGTDTIHPIHLTPYALRIMMLYVVHAQPTIVFSGSPHSAWAFTCKWNIVRTRAPNTLLYMAMAWLSGKVHTNIYFLFLYHSFVRWLVRYG